LPIGVFDLEADADFKVDDESEVANPEGPLLICNHCPASHGTQYIHVFSESALLPAPRAMKSGSSASSPPLAALSNHKVLAENTRAEGIATILEVGLPEPIEVKVVEEEDENGDGEITSNTMIQLS